MALWVCGGEDGCGTKYAVGLSRCPRCHNTAFFEDGEPMAKISRHGGASDDTLPVAEPETDTTAPEREAEPEAQTEEVPEEAPAVEPEGGEESSPGSSSSASTETPQPKPELSEPPTPSRARKMVSRSRKGQTESSSASGTDGGQETGTSGSDGSGE